MQDEVSLIDISIPTPNSNNCAPFNNTTAPIRPCTLDDINGDVNPYDNYKPTLHVLMQRDNFTTSVENAIFKQKGKSTREAIQKSYRIKLDSKSDLYKNERTFQLNKHEFDASRVRNKLAFDLFKDIPNFPSLKTEFVNLQIDGNDYGLFTHVEKVGKEYLLNRGWNKDDNLYKAQLFSFTLTPELTLNENGTPLDPQAFNALIEVERGKKQTKLIEMLKAINQENLSDSAFMLTFNRYFNRANYITWLAVNIVTSNKDTTSQNFFLLNPLYSDTFYFLPWDYDGAGHKSSYYAKWERGIGTWWSVPLHRKFLKIAANRADLDAKVDEIRAKYITPEKIKSRTDLYKVLIEEYIDRSPDNATVSKEDWLQEIDSFASRVDENIQMYKNELGVPMPFWQEVSYKNGTLTMAWDKVVDFEGDALMYDIQIASDYDFNTTLINKKNIKDSDPSLVQTSYNTSYTEQITLPSGTYYMKVIAKEENNASSYQIAFDTLVIDYKNSRFGVLEFNVE